MPTLEVLRERLTEAEEAFHHLMIGDKEASVTIGGFGGTTFTQVNRQDLERYIATLKSQIAIKARTPRRRPIFIRF